MPLPEEYVSQQFLIYAGYARRKQSGIYEGGCPICREGSSWGSKRRCFFIPKYDNIHCKNCHRSWGTRQWIAEISGKTQREITEESKDYGYVYMDTTHDNSRNKSTNSEIIPENSINLSDKQQLDFYKDNKTVQECVKFIKRRRLNKAVNRPKDLYVSLTDYIHKNRLCIPFKDIDGHIIFYQTRTVLDSKTDLPKYLSKSGSEKTVFGIENIDPDLEYIFIFEGPIDSMFVKNGVAVGGVDISKLQKAQLDLFPFHKKIWVLDNQHIDETARTVTKTLLKKGEQVFIWDRIASVKDFNDICSKKKINEISIKYIIDRSFTGIKGLFALKKVGL